ncbi:unnamed protein product [Pleuronectes platessa]|uniref:Uncharacterized protein n=1 Tax=Pleuronectes platessa TaxID=8262 RepID=A0A9N7TWR9_PLEPL|nr:unnamed protein product [Pleuronectes platessa]
MVEFEPMPTDRIFHSIGRGGKRFRACFRSRELVLGAETLTAPSPAPVRGDPPGAWFTSSLSPPLPPPPLKPPGPLSAVGQLGRTGRTAFVVARPAALARERVHGHAHARRVRATLSLLWWSHNGPLGRRHYLF